MRQKRGPVGTTLQGTACKIQDIKKTGAHVRRLTAVDFVEKQKIFMVPPHVPFGNPCDRCWCLSILLEAAVAVSEKEKETTREIVESFGIRKASETNTSINSLLLC